MAVFTNATWQVNPGRTADVLANMVRAKAIHERLGGQVSVIQSMYGGSNSGRLAYLIALPDMAALGAFNDAQAADAQWQQFVQEVLWAPNPSATLLANSVNQDLPGFEGGIPARQAPGSLMSTTAWQPQPGRLGEIMVEVAAWNTVAAKHGLTTRAVQATAAGPQTGLLTIAVLHANWSAFAATNDALQADPAFQAIWQRVSGPGSPSTSLGQTVGVVLPV